MFHLKFLMFVFCQSHAKTKEYTKTVKKHKEPCRILMTNLNIFAKFYIYSYLFIAKCPHRKLGI